MYACMLSWRHAVPVCLSVRSLHTAQHKLPQHTQPRNSTLRLHGGFGLYISKSLPGGSHLQELLLHQNHCRLPQAMCLFLAVSLPAVVAPVDSSMTCCRHSSRFACPSIDQIFISSPLHTNRRTHIMHRYAQCPRLLLLASCLLDSCLSDSHFLASHLLDSCFPRVAGLQVVVAGS